MQFAEIELNRSFRGESWVKWFRRAIKRIFRNEESRFRRRQEQQHSGAFASQQTDSVTAVNSLLDAVADNNTNMVVRIHFGADPVRATGAWGLCVMGSESHSKCTLLQQDNVQAYLSDFRPDRVGLSPHFEVIHPPPGCP